MQISTEGSGIPQKAIDGSTSSFFQADTCSLTKAEKAPWWYVNLLEPYMVQLVRLDFGKASGGEYRRESEALPSSSVCLGKCLSSSSRRLLMKLPTLVVGKCQANHV